MTEQERANKIRDLMGEHITLKALALRARVSYTTVRNVVVYNQKPDLDTLEKIAEALGVDTKSLV